MEDGSSTDGATIGSDELPRAEIQRGSTRPRARSCVDPVAEQATLGALRAGRRHEALKILMTAYSGAITAFTIRTLRNREAAKDVHQLVFLEAFQGIHKFEQRSSLWRWLCGIAYHRCLDELKRGRRMSVAGDFDVWDELAAPPDSMMEGDRVAKRRALEKCLSVLSNAMRMQVMMRCFFGLSFVEIGETIGEPHGTVQVRVSRILPRLQRCLLGEGIAR